MGDPQYGLPDLRQLLAWRSHFQLGTPPRTSEEPFFLQSSRNLAPQPQPQPPPPPPPPPPPQPQAHHHYDSPSLSMVGPHLMLPSGSGFVKLGHHHDHYCTNAAAAAAVATVPTTSTSTSTTSAAAAAAAIAPTSSTFFGVDMESGWAGTDGGNSSRWPRQETLTLLEIRSRLDSRFKEANQKGPLWDEVSRIMAEEHGYQRSGKKCREKFENLYKYYKKTKEGRAGRQDGKHYRFFRQLEALYGETSTHQASASETNVPFATNNSTTATSLYHMATNINNDNNSNYHENQETRHSESLSFSNTSDFETSSSENNDDDLSAIPYMKNRSMGKQKGLADQQEGRCQKRGKKGWKTKVKDFVDSQMTKLLDTQEAWMERMLKTIEERERDRVSREDEWRKQELARFDREHEFWAKERAWIEARDAALMEALKKYSGKGGEQLSSSVEQIAIAAAQSHYKNHEYSNISSYRWTESEILSLIQLRSSMEPKFQEESGYSSSKEVLLWEEIAAEMSSLGYDRNVDECKEKWNSMNAYFNMATTTECNKKRKEDLQTGNYFLPAAFKFQ